MEGELQEDWDVVLQSSGSTQEEKSMSLVEIDDEDGTQGIITFNYFSLENEKGLCHVEAIDEDGSVQSGSPGWIEPHSDAPYGPKHFSELWSDSSSDRLEEQRLVDDDVNKELGLENCSRSEVGIEYSESIAREKHLEKDSLDSSEEIDFVNSDEGTLTERVDESSMDPFVKSSGSGGKERGFVWWNIPVEIFKYCVYRVSPIWSLSMAAAVVGFVILGRRLYNMKKKSRTLQLKLLLDDKKVANHTARFNEVISVMKRVPVIRPALPSSVGMNQWSMMSSR